VLAASTKAVAAIKLNFFETDFFILLSVWLIDISIVLFFLSNSIFINEKTQGFTLKPTYPQP
jgi:hypothetical protein